MNPAASVHPAGKAPAGWIKFSHVWHLDTLEEIAANIMGNTICALGDAAAMPVLGYLKRFRKELEEEVAALLAKNGTVISQERDHAQDHH